MFGLHLLPISVCPRIDFAQWPTELASTVDYASLNVPAYGHSRPRHSAAAAAAANAATTMTINLLPSAVMLVR